MTDEAVLRDLMDAFNTHDLDRIMSFFTEDCVLEAPRGADPWGTRYSGSADVRDGLAARFAGIRTSTTARTSTGSATATRSPVGC